MQNDRLSRRTFLQGAAAGAALASAPASSAPAAGQSAPKILNHHEQMEYRRLGKTGLMVSAVCLGGHWKRIASIAGSGWDRVGTSLEAFDQNRWDVLSRCMDVGINYVDACSSGEILTYAKALKGRREKMYFGYSWYEREPRFAEWRTTEALVKGFDDGMQQAGLDYVDVWRFSALMTGGNSDAEVDAMVAAFEQVRKQGKARFLGISSHDREWLQKVIKRCPQVAVILTPYTASSKVKPVDSLFDAVRKQDVGVFGIKPFASGSLFRDGAGAGGKRSDRDDELARLALRYILCNDAITAPIPGLISLHQVDNAARAVRERRELDGKEAAQLGAAARDMLAHLPPDYHWLRDHEWV